MHPKQFALIGGIAMLLFGVAAFAPSLSTSPADAGLPILNLETSYGLFLGFFPMNILNKLALIVFGIGGIYAASLPATHNLPASINFSRGVFWIMGTAALLGIIPFTNTLFGYWPLFQGEVVAHATFALFGGYYGFVLSGRAIEENERRFGEHRKSADEQRRAG
jgi:hypothetical protein